MHLSLLRFQKAALRSPNFRTILCEHLGLLSYYNSPKDESLQPFPAKQSLTFLNQSKNQAHKLRIVANKGVNVCS